RGPGHLGPRLETTAPSRHAVGRPARDRVAAAAASALRDFGLARLRGVGGRMGCQFAIAWRPRVRVYDEGSRRGAASGASTTARGGIRALWLALLGRAGEPRLDPHPEPLDGGRHERHPAASSEGDELHARATPSTPFARPASITRTANVTPCRQRRW